MKKKGRGIVLMYAVDVYQGNETPFRRGAKTLSQDKLEDKVRWLANFHVIADTLSVQAERYPDEHALNGEVYIEAIGYVQK